MSEDPVTVTQRTYSAVAAQYADASVAGFPGLADAVVAFLGRVRPGAAVLDVGCGPARDTRMLREHGATAFGMDLSAAMLRTDGVPGLAQADMRRLPVRDRAVGGVWCQAALLHIPREQVPGVLAELARVLAPGGPLHLSVAEGGGEGYEDAEQYGGGRRWFVRHSEPELTARLTAAGFTVTEVSRRASRRNWLTLAAHLGARAEIVPPG